MTRWTALPDWEFRLYSGDSVPVHDIHRGSLYLPNYRDGEYDETIPVPESGWPVISAPILNDFRITAFPHSIIDDEAAEMSFSAYRRLAYLLQRGYAVWTFSIPAVRNPAEIPALIPDYQPNSSPTFSTELGQAVSYGPSYKGNGQWVDPSVDTSPYLPQHPIADPDFFNCVKGFVMATQHIMYYGAALNIDLSELYVVAGSSAMWAACRAIWAEELSTLMYPAGAGQEGVKIKGLYKGGYLRISPVWWEVFNTILIPIRFPVFPASPRKIAGALYEDFDVPDITWTYLEDDYLKTCGILEFATNPAFFDENIKGNFVLSYDQKDDIGAPYSKSNNSQVGVKPQTIWSGIALWETMNRAFPLIVEVSENAVSNFYSQIIEIDKERINWTIDYWELTSKYTYPWVDPGPSQDPIVGPSSQSINFIEIKTKKSIALKPKRYCDAANDSYIGAVKYDSLPSFEIDNPEYTGFLYDDEKCVVTLPRLDWTQQYETGEPAPDLICTTAEVVIGENGIQHLIRSFTGYLHSRQIKSSKLIEFTFYSEKSNIKGPLAPRQDLQCQIPWFGHPRCGINVPSLEVQVTVADIIGTTLILEEAPTYDPGRPTYYDKGYVEYKEVHIRVRRWVSITPKVVILNTEPPSDWLGETIRLAPGCNFHYSNCEEWENTNRFFGLGIAMPPYDAFSTGGPS